MEQKILTVTLLLCLGCALINLLRYLPRIKGWFASFKKQKRIINSKQEKMAIVVPARNESLVIDELLNSIEKQTYPKELFDLYVIVKEENDPTIKIVNDFGGNIFICKDQKCKGDALDFGLKQILKIKNKKYSGVVIVDADCVLDEHFMEEMNNSFASNRKIFLAKKNVKNYLSNNKKANSMVSCANGLIWTLMDEMGNRYKSDNNITLMTIGTGIMLSMDLVEEMDGWKYNETVTEDMELMYDCTLKGIETYYNSYSVMYVEESTNLSMTNKRRYRWLKGLIDSRRLYKERVSSLTQKKDQKNKYFVNSLWIMFRYVFSLSLLSILNLGYYLVFYLLNNPYKDVALTYSLLGVGLIYLSFFLMTAVCLIVDRKNIKLSLLKKICLLFYHPCFYMGYIPIILKASLTGISSRWDVIERINFKEN